MKINFVVIAIIFAFVGCDNSVPSDIKNERIDATYRSAMDDYSAGRIDAAMAGFEKSIRENPANSSARFQYACLKQDVKHDYVAAYCSYREYLIQQPDSDKSKLARERMMDCEKELAKILVSKYSLSSASDISSKLDAANKELVAISKKYEDAIKELDEAKHNLEVLSAERNRLLGMVKNVSVSADEEMAAVSRPSVKDVKALLEEDDLGNVSRGNSGSEVANLKQDESTELTTGSVYPLPRPSAEKQKVAGTALGAKKDAKPKEVIERPKTYIVKEGDTLYKVAKQFYGRISAWRTIREANKALISSDNRLRVGDELKLP